MTQPWPFGDLQPMRYGVILADPPWRFELFSEKGGVKGAERHYQTMAFHEMAALPVNQLAAPDAVLVMWAVAPLLDRAMELMAAWGFRFKSAGAWAKQTPGGKKWAIGTGYILRSAAEFYLLGTVGEPRQAVRNVRNLIVAQRREHSRKPDQMRVDLERMYPHAWRCELFGRQRHEGWDVWGNDVERFPMEKAA